MVDLEQSLSRLLENAPSDSVRAPLVVDDNAVSMDSLRQQVEDWKTTLLELGVSAGDRVLLAFRNSAQLVAAMFAMLSLGGVIVPVRSEGIEALLPRYLSDIKPYVVAVDEAIWPIVIASREASVKEFTSVSPGGTVGIVSRKSTASFNQQVPRSDEDEPGGIYYTSGTAGVMRGVALNRRALMYPYISQIRTIETFSFDGIAASEQERLMGVLAAPVHFTATSFASITGWTCIGRAFFFQAPLVTQTAFHPRRALELIERYGVTNIVVLPAMLEMLVREAERRTYDLSKLTIVGVGGAHLTPSRAARAEDVLGAYVIGGYGATELAGAVTSTRLGDSPTLRHTTVGRVNPGGEVSVIGTDGREVQPGTAGELVYRGEVHVGSYVGAARYGVPPPSGKTLDSDQERGSWHRTGDIAVIDEAGYIKIIGRSDEILTVAGEQVSPFDLEDVIGEHPGVQDVAVIGWRGSGGEDELVAYVVAADASTNASSVAEHLRSRVVARHVPRQFRMVSGLPTASDGKVSRAQVREMERLWRLEK